MRGSRVPFAAASVAVAANAAVVVFGDPGVWNWLALYFGLGALFLIWWIANGERRRRMEREAWGRRMKDGR